MKRLLKTVLTIIGIIVLFVLVWVIGLYFIRKQPERALYFDKELIILKLRINDKYYLSQVESDNKTKTDMYRQRSYDNIEQGNIIMYESFAYGQYLPIDQNIATDIAFSDYNITTDYLYDDIQKIIMDSVIEARYGKGLYEKIMDKYEKIKGSYQKGEITYPDKILINTYLVNHNRDDEKKTETYITNQIEESELLEKSKLKKIAFDYVVDTNGKIENVRIKLHCSKEIDSLIVASLTNLPFKWTAGTKDNKKVKFRVEFYQNWGEEIGRGIE
ncbi:MAG: hypothetical protein LBV75_08945 [Paludibacter sp.]|jgi:hypothetical protein|nr:hypothetical protein [Paludibacter sp.]